MLKLEIGIKNRTIYKPILESKKFRFEISGNSCHGKGGSSSLAFACISINLRGSGDAYIICTVDFMCGHHVICNILCTSMRMIAYF